MFAGEDREHKICKTLEGNVVITMLDCCHADISLQAF